MAIDLIDTIKPKNNGTFPMVEAKDVVVGKGTAEEMRLPAALKKAGPVVGIDTDGWDNPADNRVPSTALVKAALAKVAKVYRNSQTLVTIGTNDVDGTYGSPLLQLQEMSDGQLVRVVINSKEGLPTVEYYLVKKEALEGKLTEEAADSKITAHNAAEDAHADIREEVVQKTKAEVTDVSDSYGVSIYSIPYNNSTREGFSFAYKYDENDYHTLVLLKAKKATGQKTITIKLPSTKNISALKTAIEQGDADTLDAAKTYADGKVAGAYRYKGTMATVGDLPTSGNAEGDVYNVSADGMNYAWTGSAWDALGASVDLSDYQTKAEADDRYLQLTAGGTVNGNTKFNNTVTCGNLKSSNAPSGSQYVVRRADICNWVLPGAGLTAAVSTDEKVTLGLKPATSTSLGGVKVGSGLMVDENGTLSATGGGGSDVVLNPMNNGFLLGAPDKIFITANYSAGKANDLVALEIQNYATGAEDTIYLLKDNAIPKNMATGRFPSGTEQPIINIVWDVGFQDESGNIDYIPYNFSAFLNNEQVVKFSIGNDEGDSSIEREVPTKAYVDGLVGDIAAALAAI